jgi:hypothetical protein
MARKKQYIVTGTDGIPCTRCNLPTEIREHTEITAKHLRQPFYYSRWFYCRNHFCVVSTIMLEEHKIFGKNAAASAIQFEEETSSLFRHLSA